jgi:hypothetical protein
MCSWLAMELMSPRFWREEHGEEVSRRVLGRGMASLPVLRNTS